MSSSLSFATRLLEDAMRVRMNACALGDLDAAARADKDVARLARWINRLTPVAPVEHPPWRSFHSLLEQFPWIRRTAHG
jgi:hypothetical protein